MTRLSWGKDSRWEGLARQNSGSAPEGKTSARQQEQVGVAEEENETQRGLANSAQSLLESLPS